jgi:CBS domain-containing protein
MRRDVPTCALTDRIGDVRQRTRELGWDICVVVNEERVILGLLHSKAWDAAPETLVEEVMSNGPPTTRPSTFLDDMVDRLQKRNVPGILISDASGVLMGYLWRTDAESAMATGNCTHTWTDRDCPTSEI